MIVVKERGDGDENKKKLLRTYWKEEQNHKHHHSIWETFSNTTVQGRQYVIKGYKKIQGNKSEFFLHIFISNPFLYHTIFTQDTSMLEKWLCIKSMDNWEINPAPHACSEHNHAALGKLLTDAQQCSPE